MRSSSIHTLNADNRLSPIERIEWLFFNALNNRLPASRVDPSLVIKRFGCGELVGKWDAIDPTSSPARTLCDLFWLNLPWDFLAEQLGGSVSAVEVGCGSGKYGTLLRDNFGPRLVSYVGVDIKTHPDWDALTEKRGFKFEIGNASKVTRFLDGMNFILTQSALEHVDSDLAYFDQVAKYVKESTHPIVQFHLMPAAGSLSTFLWHGIRQYTPRTISRITRLFHGETLKTLYCLGSDRCNRVHRKWITFPRLFRGEDARYKRVEAYGQELYAAIQSDRSARNKRAAFHALMLATRFQRPMEG